MAQDQIWARIRVQAEQAARETPALAAGLAQAVLQRDNFAEALVTAVSQPMRLYASGFDVVAICQQLQRAAPTIVDDAAADLHMLVETNPACLNELVGLLGFRGWQATQAYRLAHTALGAGQATLAALLQNWAAQAWAMDISARAKIASPVWIDHGIGLVIGDTAIVEPEVSIWHGVTLGSKLRDPSNPGQRHPILRRGATVCAGASIIGSVEVGASATVAANSVVLKDVPAAATVAGVPARIVHQA